MRKKNLIGNKVHKDLYEQIQKYTGNEIDEIQFIKDNFYFQIINHIYNHYFDALTDTSPLDAYIKSGVQIYLSMTRLNQKLKINYGGKLDRYLLRLIAGQIKYRFNKSECLSFEDEATLAEKIEHKLLATSRPPLIKADRHIAFNNYIIQRGFSNQQLSQESEIPLEVISALRGGRMAFSKDLLYMTAAALELTKSEFFKFAKNVSENIEFNEKRDDIIQTALDNLILLRNMPGNEQKPAVEIVNLLLARKNCRKLTYAQDMSNHISCTKTLFITGAGGFIGRNCVEYFQKISNGTTGDSYKICVLSSKQNKNENIPDDVIYYHGNICDPLIYERILMENNVDYVIHLAAIPIVDDAEKNRNDTLDINTKSFNVLCNTILKNKIAVKGIIFPSTEQVYSGSDGCLDETAVINDIAIETTYAYFKFLGERLALRYARDGLPIIVTRLSNIYGEYDTHTTKRIIPKTIDRLMRNQPPVLYIDKTTGESQTMDFLYVGDLVEAFHLILQRLEHQKFVFNENKIIYNLGSGHEYNIETVQKLIMKIMHQDINIERREITIPRRQIMNVKKAEQEYGFTASTSLEKGLTQTVAWYTHKSIETTNLSGTS